MIGRIRRIWHLYRHLEQLRTGAVTYASWPEDRTTVQLYIGYDGDNSSVIMVDTETGESIEWLLSSA